MSFDTEKDNIYFFAFMNSIREYIDDCYGNNIIYQLSDKMPIIREGSNIITSKSDFVEKELSEHYIFSEIIKEKPIIQKKYINSDEISNLLTEMTEILQSKIDTLLNKYPYEYLFSLQQMIDYNLQISISVIKLSGDDHIDIEDIGDSRCEDICNSFLLQQQMFPGRKKSLDNALIFLNNLIARDKQVMQKMITYILHKQYAFSGLTTTDVNDFDFVEFLNLSRAFYKIIELRDIQVNNKNNKIIVQKNYINSVNYHSAGQSMSFEEIRNGMNEGDSIVGYMEFDEDISDICIKHLGMSISEIFEFSEILRKKIGLNNNLWGEEKAIVENISEVSEFDTNKIMKLFKYLVHNSDYIGNSGYSNYQRYLKKPIIKYGDSWYCIQVSIMCFSLIGLVNDIRYGEIPESKFKTDLERHIHEMREEFEDKVAERIRLDLPKAKIFVNVQQNGIVGINLYGQIDVLIKYKKIVYVVECKSLPVKYNIKSQLNVIKRLNKDFQRKLDKKVRNLREKKNYVEDFFDEGSIEKIIGLITLKYPLISTSEFENLKYPVMQFTNVVDYINSL